VVGIFERIERNVPSSFEKNRIITPPSPSRLVSHSEKRHFVADYPARVHDNYLRKTYRARESGSDDTCNRTYTNRRARRCPSSGAQIYIVRNIIDAEIVRVRSAPVRRVCTLACNDNMSARPMGSRTCLIILWYGNYVRTLLTHNIHKRMYSNTRACISPYGEECETHAYIYTRVCTYIIQ